MSGDVHVRFRERLGVRFPRATRLVETLLLNLFFAGSLKAMPARLVSDDRQHVVVGPLVYVAEDEARAYARESDLPVIGCC